jgi:hypothetical protein
MKHRHPKLKLKITKQLFRMKQRTRTHFLWFYATSNYTSAWKHSLMVGGTLGMRMTCIWGDYGHYYKFWVLQLKFSCI